MNAFTAPTWSVWGATARPPEPLVASEPRRPRSVDMGSICSDCGGMMQRTGACETCSQCGSNTGCG